MTRWSGGGVDEPDPRVNALPTLVAGEDGLRVDHLGGGEHDGVGKPETAMAGAQPGGADGHGLVQGYWRAERRDHLAAALVECLLAHPGDPDQHLREHACRQEEAGALGSVGCRGGAFRGRPSDVAWAGILPW